jgi:hypothetical protein
MESQGASAAPPTAPSTVVEPVLPPILLSPDRALNGTVSPSGGSTRHSLQNMTSQGGDSVPLVTLEDQRPNQNLDPALHVSLPSKLNGIYWRSPASMVIWFLVGTLMALDHHLYYRSLDGQVVGDVDEQQRKLRSEPHLAWTCSF